MAFCGSFAHFGPKPQTEVINVCLHNISAKNWEMDVAQSHRTAKGSHKLNGIFSIKVFE
jgi:hypothetical protein